MLCSTGSTTIIPAAVLLYTSLVHEDIMYTLTIPPDIGRLQLVEDREDVTSVMDLQQDAAFTQNMVDQGEV